MEQKSCLNGYWDFLPSEGLGIGEAEKSDRWIRGRYQVPSSWMFGDPMYDIFDYPEEWSRYSEGYLSRTVTVERRPGKRYFLRLDAVGQRAEVYVNGLLAGATDDMFLPLETELTGFLSDGTNRLRITVFCSSFVNNGSKCLVPTGTWYAGQTRGIWQDAWLIERSGAFIENCFVKTEYESKRISYTAAVSGAEDYRIRAFVEDPEGRTVLTFDGASAVFENVRCWMPDDPYQYDLKLVLYVKDLPVSAFVQRFGFREITCKGKDLYINRVRLHLRGDAWHYQGLAMQTREYALNWCRFAKENGINLIRPHGFPYPPCFYEAADETGVFLMAESGIYGSGKSMQADDERYIRACRKHLKDFVLRYRNHPSVLCWSMQNEMRWVDGRDGYQKHIPELMAILHEGDPSRRLVSCDGDNRLLTSEMMEAVSMHYNIDGRIQDWDRTKPLFFGEHGAYHYVAPQAAADYIGDRGFSSFWEANRGVSEKEAVFLRYARQEEVTAVTPFNYVNYMNKAMPFEDLVLDDPDITSPGVHPKRVRAYSLTLNNGRMKGYPAYIPQPALKALARETAEIAVLPAECDTSFFENRTVSRRFYAYNDTCRTHEASVDCIAELENGRLLLAETEEYTALPGDRKTLDYRIRIPACGKKQKLTVRFTVRFDGVPVRKEEYVYTVCPHVRLSEPGRRIVCFGTEESLPAELVPGVLCVTEPGELAKADADVLIVGESSRSSQKELQPILKELTETGRVKAVFLLAQDTFVPGSLKLSKKTFPIVHKTGKDDFLRELGPEELRFWSGENPFDTEAGSPVRNAFDKPETDGYRVLLDCAQGDFGWGGLDWAAMLECEENGCPVILTQLRLTEFYRTVPAAEQIFVRTLEYLLDYRSLPYCQGKEPDSAEALQALLAEGRTVVVTKADEKLPLLLSVPELRRIGLSAEEKETWQVVRTGAPLTEHISDSDLSGLHHTTYSSENLKNNVVAEKAFRYRTEGTDVSAERLFVSSGAPWTDLYLHGKQSEYCKVAYATEFSDTDREEACYGLSVEAGGGKLVLLSLKPENDPYLARAVSHLKRNCGFRLPTGIFDTFKQPEQYAVSRIMWLPVSERWDYGKAVSYHADPDYFLNNLGEGSYGWMQRVESEDGLLRFGNSAGQGVFATVFIRCALNHDPEHREGGIPDPTIVPDLTVRTNRPVTVWVNGVRFEPARSGPGESTEKIEDTLLRKGLNRLFFEIRPGAEDAYLEAVFQDKLGNVLDDASYLCTLD